MEGENLIINGLTSFNCELEAKGVYIISDKYCI